MAIRKCTTKNKTAHEHYQDALASWLIRDNVTTTRELEEACKALDREQTLDPLRSLWKSVAKLLHEVFIGPTVIRPRIQPTRPLYNEEPLFHVQPHQDNLTPAEIERLSRKRYGSDRIQQMQPEVLTLRSEATNGRTD